MAYATVTDTCHGTSRGIFARLGAWLAERHQRRINRAAFRNLLSLDDQMLRDIGVTRNDVMWASELPLSRNAALELERVARGGGAI